MKMRSIIVLVIIIVVAIVISVLPKKSNNTESPDLTPGGSSIPPGTVSPVPPAPPAPPAPSGGPKPAEEVSIDITNFKFSQESLKVKAGTKVTWTNNDEVKHTVTGTSGGPDSALFGKGESFSYTFTAPGTFDYYCKPHPFMKASITVTE
jgi:amicyanin